MGEQEAKYTPGPWRINDGSYSFLIGGKIHIESALNLEGDIVTLQRTISTIKDDFPVDLANARLIAAAPELLEALDDMLAMIYEGVPKDEWPAIQARAKAAIAKAKAA